MVDVTRLPANALGYVPTPAIVAPIEFTLPVDTYRSLGGHMEHVIDIGEVVKEADGEAVVKAWPANNPWPLGEST